MPQINTGDDIDKAAIITRFNEVLRNQINPVIDVGSGTPFTTGTYRELTNTTTAVVKGIPAPTVGAPTVTPALTSGITDTIVDASGLATYLRNITREYSQVRKLNWRLRFNRTGYPSGNGNVIEEQTTTEYIHLNSPAYLQTVVDRSATYNIETGDVITAGTPSPKADFEGFIQDLYEQWNTLKENAVTINVDLCHSSCHGNCHSSRARR